jgi:NAD(P)-dependent dehydrogenase (short-subunit alcohol dehydrogenase family)
MNLGLTGKLALVTGSTAGIGYAIAEALAREGARVIVNGHAKESVEAAVARLNAMSQESPFGFPGDLSTAAAADVARRFPAVEILVNNLGIFEPKPFAEITDAGGSDSSRSTSSAAFGWRACSCRR